MLRNISKTYGIDHGTTNSSIAYYDTYAQKGICVQNAEGSFMTPSAVCIYENDDVVVGSAAAELALINCERTATLYKRAMGTENAFLTVDGKDYSPEQIGSIVMKSLCKDVEEELEEQVEKVVITVPAYFNTNQRKATEAAGILAGFEVMDLLDEPIAGLYHADSIRELQGNCLVLDLGGGTFDVAVAKVTDDCIEEICVAGDNYLGGSDFSRLLQEEIKKKYFRGKILDAEQNQELLLKTELAKKALSEKEEANFTLVLGDDRVQVRVTRKEFEECTRELLYRIANVIQDVNDTLEDKGEEINTIVFVGGATRMVSFRKLIEDCFPQKEIIAVNVDQAVACGAAIYAYRLAQGEKIRELKKDIGKITALKRITRVSSRSYGIAAYVEDNRKICNMLKHNEKLPTENEEVYYTRFDNQKMVQLDCYEDTSECRYESLDRGSIIGTCTLELNGDFPKGTPILVQLSLDKSGLLQLRGRETTGKTEIKSYFKTNALLNTDELEVQKTQIEGLLSNV